LKNKALIFLYYKKNRYSVNALLGALESFFYEFYFDIFLFSPQDFIKNLKKIQESYSKIIISFSFCTPDFFMINDIIKEVKSIKKNFLLLAGGPHPSALPKKMINNGIDIVLRGEGERKFPELINRLFLDENYEDLPGIVYKLNGKIKINKIEKEKIDLNKYIPFSLKFEKFGPIEITRGCPYACKFCQTSSLFGRKNRHREINAILNLVEIKFKRGLKDIRFITPNALSYGSKDGINPKYEKIEQLLKEIKKIIKKEGRIFFGSFPSEVRPEHLTEEILNFLSKICDNKTLNIGAQSGSNRILELCRRNHTVDDIHKAVELSLKYGFIPNVDIIFGLPGENNEDIKDTLKLIDFLVEKGAKVHAHTFMPLPQTYFSKFKPVEKIPDFLIKSINKYLSQGVIYGQWEKQLLHAKRIFKLLNQHN